MDDEILYATAPTLKLEFGSPPLFTNPFTSPTPPSPTPSKHVSKYLDHLNTLGFSQSEQGVIVKLNLDWILCHTEWPAFHWDMSALESTVKNWAESESGSGFGFDTDFLHLEPRASVCELRGEILVGPMDFSSRTNFAPGPDGFDKFSDGDIVNDGTAEMVSDDVKGEDIPWCCTADFEFLPSSLSSNASPSNSPNPANIPLLFSDLGSSEYTESAYADLDWDLGSEEHPELAPIEVEETKVRSMIGSSLVALLSSDELDAECSGQTRTEDLGVNSNDEMPVVVHGTSAHEDESMTDTIKSLEAGSADVTLVEAPDKPSIDPIKLSKLTQLSTIPVAGDPALLRLLSTLPVPPFPESQSDLHISPTPNQIQARLQIFKKDVELCTKSQIMDTQGTITNEVGAQLRCGCDECRPVAMKTLFGDWDWDWLLDGDNESFICDGEKSF